jgi:Spy/CpxP family protein refolding chaperone
MHQGMACPTCGCSMGHGHHKGGMKMMFKKLPWKIMMHADELGIGEDQIEALRSKHVEAKKKMIQIGCQIKMTMVDFKDAVMRDEIDVQTAESKARDIGKLKGDMLMTMIQTMQDMRQILTPDQRMKVKKMIMSWSKKGEMSGMESEEGEEGESGEASEE